MVSVSAIQLTNKNLINMVRAIASGALPTNRLILEIASPLSRHNEGALPRFVQTQSRQDRMPDGCAAVGRVGLIDPHNRTEEEDKMLERSVHEVPSVPLSYHTWSLRNRTQAE